MKTLTIITLAGALALGGCGTLGGGSGSAVAEKALSNLEHCKRTYQAAIGAMGAPGGSLYIECPAKPFDAPVTTVVRE